MKNRTLFKRIIVPSIDFYGKKCKLSLDFIPLTSLSCPSLKIMDGKFAENFSYEYNNLVEKLNNNYLLDIHTSYPESTIQRVNVYSNILISNLLEKNHNIKMAGYDEVLKITKICSVLDQITLELGLILRSEKGSNEYHARQLGSQARKRGYSFSKKNPLVFNSSDLDLFIDKNSPSELGFKIKDSAKPFYLPRKINNSAKDGLFDFYISNKIFHSDISNLTNSDFDSRILLWDE